MYINGHGHIDEFFQFRAICETATQSILCLLQRNMSITICVKWSGKEYEVTELAATDTVETLKVGGKDEWNSFEPCTFRWKSWGRLGWDQRDKSCWIWRYFWTLSHNSWRLQTNCLTLRWKERRQQTVWSWGILDWNRTSSSWWWAGNRKSSIKIFSLPFLHEAWKRRSLKHRLSLRICRKF